MLQSLQSIFRIPELKRRIFLTMGLLVVYRLGGHIPTPGVNGERPDQLLRQSQAAEHALRALRPVRRAGTSARRRSSRSGIMPYISASIILQLFGAVIPYFERLQKEGEEGRKKITQYTRYGTVLLSLVQSSGSRSSWRA